MKLKHLTVRNFGPYTEKTFKMEHIMFYLDLNGKGKTTFLRALNFALDGDYEAGMMKSGCKEMSVQLVFQNGFVVERHRKGNASTHKMGIGVTKQVTKEACTTEIVRQFKVPMNSIKVIASSRELFEMKPDAMAEFFMRHIPNRMTADDVVGYIDDITPEQERIVRSSLPTEGDFGQDTISILYTKFDNERKNLSREQKLLKAKIQGYDFNAKVREQDEVQNELNNLMASIGQMQERLRVSVDIQKQRLTWEKTLLHLQILKDEFNKIIAVKTPPEKYDEILSEENKTRQMIQSVKSLISTQEVSLDVVRNVAKSLVNGMCPQVEGIKCPKDWSEKLAELKVQEEHLSKALRVAEKNVIEMTKKLEDTIALKVSCQQQDKLFELKASKYREYQSLRVSLVERPKEPEINCEMIDKEIEQLQKTKGVLEAELRASMKHQDMVNNKNALEKTEAKLRIYEVLARAFSKKGEVLEKNLAYYLSFFEKQIGKKAQMLGYRIKLSSDGGLHILIGHDSEQLTDIVFASTGEKAIGIFLILDLLNSITGINLLFFDDVEKLDNGVWQKLLEILKEYGKDYDHIIFSGVNHSDTIAAVNKIFQMEETA